MTDSMATTLRIIDEAKVGFAPGGTFGAGGEGHLRMCFLRDTPLIEEALNRFERAANGNYAKPLWVSGWPWDWAWVDR